jgi:hypothetical protein
MPAAPTPEMTSNTITFAAAGIRNFSRAGTPVQSVRPTRVLVTTGVHGWTRNPIRRLYLRYQTSPAGAGLAERCQKRPWHGKRPATFCFGLIKFRQRSLL